MAELPLEGRDVVLRPLAEGDTAALRAMRDHPAVARWWGRCEDGFPASDEPEATRFGILADGELVGMIQFGEEDEPDWRHAWIDVFLDPCAQGRGLGTDAVATLLAYLHEQRGHHRVTIDPEAANGPAIRSYEKAGFRPVGVLERAWRHPDDGEWRDMLLMEHVLPR